MRRWLGRVAALAVLPALRAAPVGAAPAGDGPGLPGGWVHPAGMVTRQTLDEMREKCRRYAWAREVCEDLARSVRPWVEVPLERLRQLTPKRRGNVYHNFSCPDDRARLVFDPFVDDAFRCPRCGKTFPAGMESNVYPPGNVYHGTLYDGWACLYFITAAQTAWRLGLAWQLTGEEGCARRAAEILLLYADLLPGMPREMVGGSKVIFTYNREGEVRLLEFAAAYELVRDSGFLDGQARQHVERDFLKPFCDDAFMDPELRSDWNNVYWWQLAIAQTGLALEDRHYLEYALGLGDYAPDRRPQHRSLTYAALHHFRPDGAHFGLNTGYQLYPLTAMLQVLALGVNISRQEPERFPPAEFDATDPGHPVGAVARRAIHWYLSLALPDGSMAVVGDSMYSRDSMKAYDPCAEIAYRYFGADAVAWHPEMLGARGLWGLIWGAADVVRRPVPYESARLSSGFTALRRDAGGNRMYVGLNHLQPGDGHQHADRLGIIAYARGQLLGLEKGTPYNNATVQEAARSSWSHNTVTVDRTSQPNGSTLKGDQIPVARYVQSDPECEYAEASADRIYAAAERYRRAIVLAGGVVLDVFTVSGGRTHDWFYHCAGELEIGLPVTAGKGFDTPAYVTGGTDRYEHAVTGDAWHGTWTLPPPADSRGNGPGKPVRHRVFMLGAPGTEVFRLGTYPVQQSGTASPGLTDDHTAAHLSGGAPAAGAGAGPFAGLTQSLLVRRVDSAAPFVALYDTFEGEPSVLEFVAVPVTGADAGAGVAACRWRTGAGVWYAVYAAEARGPLEFAGPRGPARVEAHFALIRTGAGGSVQGVALLGGRSVAFGGLEVRLPEPGNLFLTRTETGAFAARTAADLAFETLAGIRQEAPCGPVTATVAEEGVAVQVTAPGRPW